MATLKTNRFSLVGFAAAVAITASLNGAMLMGFDQLASKQDDAAGGSQLVKAEGVTKQVTLQRVTISARRA